MTLAGTLVLAQIFISLIPVPVKDLHCQKHTACEHPAFALHGYGFRNENMRMPSPLVRMESDGSYTAHITFSPPFAPSICEAFQVLGGDANPLAKHPFKDIHETHLELNGFAPDQALEIGIDCWHIGHDQNVTFSTVYMGMPLDAR